MSAHGHHDNHQHHHHNEHLETVHIRVGILTMSDKGSRGEREDKSGAVIKEILGEINAEIPLYEVIPDEMELITEKLNEWKGQVNLILTTGGTGVAPRDVTPEATRAVLDRELPGYPEAMRMESLRITPRAMGTRAVAGVAGQCLIVNLPGSPKAVEECLRVILPVIPHTIAVIQGNVDECARK